MKSNLLCLLFALGLSFPCFGQENPLPETPRPRIIVQTGIGMQWIGKPYKLWTYSIEIPESATCHLGFQGNLYFEEIPEFVSDLHFLGGYELGGFAKYFLKSKHKTRVYAGPELRLGVRKFKYLPLDFFPLPTPPTYLHYQENIVKLLLRCGIQRSFGHGILELAMPMGIEFNRTNSAPNQDAIVKKFRIMPMLQMGVAF